MRNNPSLSKPGATFKQRHPKIPSGKRLWSQDIILCQRSDKENKGGDGEVGGKGGVLLPQYSLIMMMWFAGMAAVALVTNTSSPEPRNSALLNFMKGLAVQFMSLPAEDRSVQRQRKHCSTTSHEIAQSEKFYPWQYFSLTLFRDANTRQRFRLILQEVRYRVKYMIVPSRTHARWWT